MLVKSTIQSVQNKDTKQSKLKKIDEMDYWAPSSKLLRDTSIFLHSLFSYDKDNISQEMIKMIEPIILQDNF